MKAGVRSVNPGLGWNASYNYFHSTILLHPLSLKLIQNKFKTNSKQIQNKFNHQLTNLHPKLKKIRKRRKKCFCQSHKIGTWIYHFPSISTINMTGLHQYFTNTNTKISMKGPLSSTERGHQISLFPFAQEYNPWTYLMFCSETNFHPLHTFAEFSIYVWTFVIRRGNL